MGTKDDKRGMGMSEINGSFDSFIANEMFPEPAAVFTSHPISLDAAKESACVVLDTNALLVPYGIGPQTLSQVEATYRHLIEKKRLVIPAQVAREFARNRVSKLAELHQKLSRKRSQLQTFKQGTYPLLDGLNEYSKLRDVEEQLDRLADEYRSLLSAVVEHVRSWEWNDPVSILYGKIFTSDVIIDTIKSQDEIRHEHARRFIHKIPPGYKDDGKDDQGIGDLLIWLAILELGASRQTSVVFVSGEEKADWWHRSDGQPLYPRYELVEEFRRASGGRSFHIIKFSRLLELFGASSDVVTEVRDEERATASPILPATVPAKGIGNSIAAWFRSGGHEVFARHHLDAYDLWVEPPNGEGQAVFIISSDSQPDFFSTFHYHIERYLIQSPAIIVLVTQEHAVRAGICQIWRDINFGHTLIAGWIAPDGNFQTSDVVKPRGPHVTS